MLVMGWRLWRQLPLHATEIRASGREKIVKGCWTKLLVGRCCCWMWKLQESSGVFRSLIHDPRTLVIYGEGSSDTQFPQLLQELAEGLGHAWRHTVRTRIINPRARTLELPLLVRSSTFLFFFCVKPGMRQSVFSQCSRPLSKRGNSGSLSARFNYSSSHGRDACDPYGSECVLLRFTHAPVITISLEERREREQKTKGNDVYTPTIRIQLQALKQILSHYRYAS